jgi:hypothetical protein
MREFLNRLRNAWRVFLRMISGKPLTVLDFQNVLATLPDQPVAKVVHTTRKFTALQFIVKLPRPKNKKVKGGVAW